MQIRRVRGSLIPALSLPLLLVASTVSAQTTVTPAPNMDIHRAGGNTTSAGTNPVERPLVFEPGDVVRFTSVSGSTDCDGEGEECDLRGPDGNLGLDLVVPSVNLLSGIAYRGAFSLPLMGVFLGDSLPAVAPDPLDFRNAEDFERVDPELGQLFWVGDGKTGTLVGTLQEFGIPDGATRIALGFLDPDHGDNSGGLLATFEIVPEPAGAALGLTTLAGLYAVSRRRAAA